MFGVWGPWFARDGSLLLRQFRHHGMFCHRHGTFCPPRDGNKSWSHCTSLLFFLWICNISTCNSLPARARVCVCVCARAQICGIFWRPSRWVLQAQECRLLLRIQHYQTFSFARYDVALEDLHIYTFQFSIWLAMPVGAYDRRLGSLSVVVSLQCYVCDVCRALLIPFVVDSLFCMLSPPL